MRCTDKNGIPCRYSRADTLSEKEKQAKESRAGVSSYDNTGGERHRAGTVGQTLFRRKRITRKSRVRNDAAFCMSAVKTAGLRLFRTENRIDGGGLP